MALTGTSPTRPAQRAALDILRGRSRRRRKPTAAELANERRIFDELAELMEAGVLVDRSELVPPLEEDELITVALHASGATQLSLDHVVPKSPICGLCHPPATGHA